MGFFSFLSKEPTSFRKLYLNLHRFNCISFQPINAEEFRFNFEYPHAHPELGLIIDEYRRAGTSALTAAYTWTKALAHGPKVFRLDARKWEALENYEVNVPVEEYHQPFQTVIFDIPSDYATNRVVPYNAESGIEVGDRIKPNMADRNAERVDRMLQERYYPGAVCEHYPDFIICHLSEKKDWVMVNILMDSSQSITYVIYLQPGKTLEQTWEKNKIIHNDKGVSMTPEEVKLANNLIRAIFNANLLLCHYGSKKIGPAAPSLYEQLNSRLSRKVKAKPEVIEQNRIERDTMPVYYDFIDQKIRLHAEEKTPHDESLPSGRTIRPHWRSGHYRHQWYGSNGNRHQKLIPIPPVMVNADRFFGDEENTTYQKG